MNDYDDLKKWYVYGDVYDEDTPTDLGPYIPWILFIVLLILMF